MNTSTQTITMGQQHINTATKLGYEDPFTNDQRDILEFTLGNKEYRRFIIGFNRLAHNVIFNNNVRQQEVDETYCREELIPKIKKSGLRCPIFVVQNGQSYIIESGHHRRYSSEEIYGVNTPMPCFILSSYVCEVLPGGQYGPKQHGDFLRKISLIRSNPPRQNKAYVMKDAEYHLKDLRRSDPTFSGLIANGAFPTRQEFDLVMDLVYPDDFGYKGTRTKIHNSLTKGNTTSKNKSVSFSDITNDLVLLGYDTGVAKTKSGKTKREKFLDWEDKKNNVYLGVGDANSGTNFQRNFCMSVIEAMGNGTIDKKTKYDFVIHCTVYSASSTLVALNKQRKNHEDLMREWNNYFKNFGYSNVRFSKVIWPKQLVSKTDQTKIVDLVKKK